MCVFEIHLNVILSSIPRGFSGGHPVVFLKINKIDKFNDSFFLSFFHFQCIRQKIYVYRIFSNLIRTLFTVSEG